MKKVFLLFLILLFANVAYAEDATITWDAPTVNEDGTLLTDLAGYKLFYGTAPRDYHEVTDLGMLICPEGKCELRYPLIGDAIHYFSVIAYDLFGNESVLSNEGQKKSSTIPEGVTITVY